LTAIIKSAGNQLGVGEGAAAEAFTCECDKKNEIAQGPWYDCFYGTANCAAQELGVSVEAVIQGWLQYREHFAEPLARGLITKKDIALVPRQDKKRGRGE
jgi:hypothetical protein